MSFVSFENISSDKDFTLFRQKKNGEEEEEKADLGIIMVSGREMSEVDPIAGIVCWVFLIDRMPTAPFDRLLVIASVIILAFSREII